MSHIRGLPSRLNRKPPALDGRMRVCGRLSTAAKFEHARARAVQRRPDPRGDRDCSRTSGAAAPAEVLGMPRPQFGALSAADQMHIKRNVGLF